MNEPLHWSVHRGDLHFNCHRHFLLIICLVNLHKPLLKFNFATRRIGTYLHNASLLGMNGSSGQDSRRLTLCTLASHLLHGDFVVAKPSCVVALTEGIFKALKNSLLPPCQARFVWHISPANFLSLVGLFHASQIPLESISGTVQLTSSLVVKGRSDNNTTLERHKWRCSEPRNRPHFRFLHDMTVYDHRSHPRSESPRAFLDCRSFHTWPNWSALNKCKLRALVGSWLNLS